MSTPKTWKGYRPDFLDGFTVPIPKFGKWKSDLALNQDTGEAELPFIHFSSWQSVSRRLPVLTASNIYRDKWIQKARTGAFDPDDRLNDEEQLSDGIYKDLNIGHPDMQRKMAKGHMVRREDVQWDAKGVEENAVEASIATFHYSNACPQHQALNNVVWKQLENSILVKGRSRDPKKAIVFTGPVLDDHDPWLVFHKETDLKIRCPLVFWKVVYYVKEDDNDLHYAAFRMSHKDLVETDGYVTSEIKELLRVEKAPKEFLDFDDRYQYQVNISMIEKLTGLSFPKAKEALPEGETRKLQMEPQEKAVRGRMEEMSAFVGEPLVEGLVV